jgi:DNA-binding NarL/FixJ family response regulator
MAPETADRPIRVLIVDDHAVFRAALRMLLQRENEIEVIGDVENGRAALQFAENHEPDVIVMDAVMPGLNGIDATRQLKKRLRKVKVVMLTGVTDEDQLREAIRAGASGYITKHSQEMELLLAIRTVHRGNPYISMDIADGVDVADIIHEARRSDAQDDVLTIREREVLQLIAEGNTNQGMADELSISVKTVEAHKTHIMKKLRTRNRTDLIRYALRKGIVRVESVEPSHRALLDGNPAGDGA